MKENKADSHFGAYLFTHFAGSERTELNEQVYFAVSKDGINWQSLNNKKPVLISSTGERGARDPYILRSPENGKYFIIATDLSTYNRRSDPKLWDSCQKSGSQSIIVWESSDLVDWSEARLAKVAPDNAGCVWAPETFYDTKTRRHMVFWASKTADDGYEKQRMYRCYTNDFIHFTKPEIFMESTDGHIDATLIEHNGFYYRFTKNESKKFVTMECSTNLESGYEEVALYMIDNTAGNTITGYEGPIIFKMNSEEKWCLLMDNYARSKGYKAFLTDDISTGIFVSADFHFDNTYRHGTVMPITLDEYDILIKTYSFL